MKTAVGRSALLSGVPEMGLDTDELFRNLQVRCHRLQECVLADNASSLCGWCAKPCHAAGTYSHVIFGLRA